MSVDLHDLGLRLRAAHNGRPVPRIAARRQPLDALHIDTGTVAVAVTPIGTNAVDLRARVVSSNLVVHHGVGDEALPALAKALTGNVELPWRLAIGSRRELRLLAACAAVTPPEHPNAETASLVAWWADRADHPDSGAVTIMLEALPQRWVTADPDAESTLNGWAGLLGVTAAKQVDTIVGLAQRLAADPSPPTHADTGGDLRAFERRGSWRLPHNAAGAAIRLRARCDSADAAESKLLRDQLWGKRAKWSGDVVTGEALPAQGASRLVVTDLPVCRFMEGDSVYVEGDQHHANATVTSVEVSNDATHLIVEIELEAKASLRAGRVTIYPAAYLGAGRALTNLSDRFAMANWPVRRGALAPAPHRTPPLDVAIAAADL